MRLFVRKAHAVAQNGGVTGERVAMPRIDFELDREFVELNQLLKLAGVCDSGGMGKQIVATGEVTVDDVQELRKTAKIRAGQVVRLDDIEIHVIPG